MKKILFLLICGIFFTTNLFASEEKIVYTKEYVAQYLGEVITVSFFNDNEKFNQITFIMGGVIVKYKYKPKGKKEIKYYIIGQSANIREVSININKIRRIQ